MKTIYKAKLLLSTAMIAGGIIAPHTAFATCAPVVTGGDDTITCTGNYVPNLNTGNGNDRVNIQSDAYLFRSLTTGDGTDTVTIGSNATIRGLLNTGDGNDTVTMDNGSTIINTTTLGSGDDTLTAVGASLRSISAGDGNDTISVTNSSITWDIQGGDGNDIITVNNTTIGGVANARGSITGGDGDDVILITNGSDLTRAVSGNDGDDTITVNGGSAVQYLYGNGGNNRLVLTDSEVRYRVQSDGGDDTVTLTNSTVGSTVSLGNGINTLVIDDTSVGLDVTTGSDNDNITIRNSSTIARAVSSGAGNDTLRLNNSSIGSFLNTGAGDDAVTINTSTIGSYVSLGDGNDTLNMTSGTLGSYLSLGAGDNTVTATRSTVGGNITSTGGMDTISITGSTVDGYISSGAGDDTLTLNATMVNRSVLSGTGNDVINILSGSHVGVESTSNSRTIDAGDGDDVVNIDGTVTGFVDLGNGDDSIVLDANVVIDTTNVFAVYGEGGDDTITVNGGTFQAGISGGAGADTLTLRGGSIEEINAGAGDDIINIYGGIVTDPTGVRGIRAGSGNDILTVDPTGSSIALDLTALDSFNGDGGTDSAVFKNVVSGTHLADNFDLIGWQDVTFENSQINIGRYVTVRELFLTNNSVLTQTDGRLPDSGGGGGSFIDLHVDGTSRITMVDDTTDDAIFANYFGAAGSVLSLDVDVTDRGLALDASDYVRGGTHMSEAGALIELNILGDSDLSGSRRIIQGSGGNVPDPGAGATEAPSEIYSLVNDPSTASRKFWLENDGSGGVFLVWTTPVSGATTGGFLGGGAVLAGTGPNDPNYTVDTSGPGAGAGDIMAGGAVGGASGGGAISNIADFAAVGAGAFGGTNESGANGAGKQRSTRGGKYSSCQTGSKANAWVSGSLSNSSFGESSGDSRSASLGLERDLGDLFETNCGQVAAGAFVYFGSTDLDLNFGSTNNINSTGFGGYLRGATQNGLYGLVAAHTGNNDIMAVNTTLESTSDYDTGVWGVTAVAGKIFPIAPDMTTDLRASASYGYSDTDLFSDSNGFTVSGINGDSKTYSGTAGVNKAFGTIAWGFARAGVKHIDMATHLTAYGNSVDSTPSYTTGIGQLGINGALGSVARYELAGFGETGSDVETYGISAKIQVKF